jgi:hypothetical protein
MPQSAPLHRLYYRSRLAPFAAADLARVVEQIVEASIRRNRAVGLTGLLVVVKNHFVQVLEGDVNELRTTYARISMDRRHYDPSIICQGPASRRLFGDWNMCASTLAASDRAILEVLEGKEDFNPQALTAAGAERLLVAVAAVQRRAA